MINKDEAPEGYYATVMETHKDNNITWGCTGCAFDNGQGLDSCNLRNLPDSLRCCDSSHRIDQESVIFKKKVTETCNSFFSPLPSKGNAVFDKSKVYTVLNAEELKVGSKVILASSLYNLKVMFRNLDNIVTTTLLKKVLDETHTSRFYDGCYNWELAYLLEESPVKYDVCVKGFETPIKRLIIHAICKDLTNKGYKGYWEGDRNHLLIDTTEKTFSYVDCFIDRYTSYTDLSYIDALEGNY